MATLSEASIEQEIVAKGLVAPRITPEQLDGTIGSIFYFTAAEGVKGQSEGGTAPSGKAESLNRLTFCVLVLTNGFTVTGESSCVSPENFDEEVGKKNAYNNAREKIRALEGYRLRQALYEKDIAAESLGRQSANCVV